MVLPVSFDVPLSPMFSFSLVERFLSCFAVPEPDEKSLRNSITVLVNVIDDFESVSSAPFSVIVIDLDFLVRAFFLGRGAAPGLDEVVSFEAA